jgi:hypothetical protein
LRPWRQAATAGAATLALAACATSPTPQGVATAPTPPADVMVAQRERLASQEAEAARKATAAGRLHDALWRWRVVEAVARDPAEARREEAELATRMSAEADREVAKADAAKRARNPGEALAAYQRALALDPKRPAALAYLREAETSAVLRAVAQEQSAASHKRKPKRAKGE